jgi:hypothetical protein
VKVAKSLSTHALAMMRAARLGGRCRGDAGEAATGFDLDLCRPAATIGRDDGHGERRDESARRGVAESRNASDNYDKV